MFVLALVASLAAMAQSFEGKIAYKIVLKSKNPKMTDEQWSQMMGSKQDYFIKEGSYKSISNGSVSQWQLYVNKDNKVYTKMGSSETVFWNDGAVNQDEVLKAEIKKNVATILGYACDELTLTCKSGIQKYYFSNKLALDPKLFENHKYGNWYEYLKNSRSLPLKMIIETSHFTMETVATEVSPMKLEDSFPSPY